MTRFVVMAMLQAARAQALGLPVESAYSWGLNRAIFYAAAKRGFRATAAGGEASGEGGTAPSGQRYRLGDEEAYRLSDSGPLLFIIGDHPQTRSEFERQIAARFRTKDNFQSAWDEAVRIVKTFDRATLESRRRFFDEVYKPRRDELSQDWSHKYAPSGEP